MLIPQGHGGGHLGPIEALAGRTGHREGEAQVCQACMNDRKMSLFQTHSF
jgi:hypothetical protein